MSKWSRIVLVLLSNVYIVMSYANNNHNQLNESNMITIPPHSRSAAVNAKHAKECAEMGGVDITDSSTMVVGSSVEDAHICKLNINSSKIMANHVSTIMGVSATSTPATGYHSTPTYSGTSYATFVVGGVDPSLKSLGMGMDFVEPGGSASQCGGPASQCGSCVMIGVSSGTYSLSLSCKMVRGGYVLSYSHADAHLSNSKAVAIASGQGYIIHPDKDNMISNDKNIGNQIDLPSCNLPLSFVGNPINIITGNKYQSEIDIYKSGVFPLLFERIYNSMNGIWRHNYSTNIESIVDTDNSSIKMITLMTADGRAIRFYDESGIIKPSPTELGALKRTSNGYEYTSPFHEISDFDSAGRLIRTVSSSGLVHNIKHVSDTELIVSDTFGHSLTITETKDHQPLSVKSSDGTTVHYEYDSSNRLVKVTKNGKSRVYHYEDNRFPTALTGITDERGVRYATWGYDSSGRANLSEHSDGKDKVSITYNSDTQTTFTNPLGRKYTYNYKVIDGVKRITSIQGAASSLCPAIGSSYEYNSRGLVTVKTDGKGIKTTYEYNDAGQEISRTIGVGTPEALTIKTTWDDRFFAKPKTETYPDKVITYNYDNNGNLLNQTVKTLN